MALASYNPAEVVMFLADIIQIDDVMDGTFIQISKDTQVFSSSTSTDGQVYRRRNSNSNYTITLTLTSSSRSSRVLQYFLIADQTTSIAKFPIFIKDMSGSTLFHATTCWVEQQPDIIFSEQVSARTWIIRATGTTLAYGDNYSRSSITDDTLSVVVGSIPSIAGLIQ